MILLPDRRISFVLALIRVVLGRKLDGANGR